MSEEIKNEEGLSPEVAEADQEGAESEVAAEAEDSAPEVPDAAEGDSESGSDAEGDAGEEGAPAEEAEPAVDLSHMNWEDRVSYYKSLGTADGYIEAIRLIDFHNPGDIQVAEVWGEALREHGELAREIYAGASRKITSEPDVWSNILESHKVALEDASDEGQLAIGEVIGLIQCLRTGDIADGKERLAGYDKPEYAEVLSNLDVVASGNWRKVEQAVEAQVKAKLSDENEIAVECAHIVADYALSAKALDRAVEMMRRTSRKVTTDIGLKWRLAILSRDQKKWNAYVDVLNKELIGVTESVEGKVDIYNAMIKIYRDETKQEPMVVKTYEALIGVDPENREALESLVDIYEKMRRWPDLIKVLDAQAATSEGDRKVEFYLRIAQIYLNNLSRKVDAIKYFENVLEVDPIHEESLEQLKTLYTERRDWEKLIEVHRKELQRMDSVDDQITRLKEMADIAKTKLRNNNVSIDIWKQVLDRDAENTEAITALETLLEGEKRWADLASIIERKISQMSDEQEQFAELQRLGAMYSDRANDNVSAIATWRRVLAIDPTYTKGVENLRKLLIEERDWASLEEYYSENNILPDLVKLFEQLSKSLKDDADKKAVLLRAAHVYEHNLGESDKAMATLEKILEIDAKDAVAAKELVSYYEPRGLYDQLANMLAILHNSCEKGEERSAYGLRLAKLYETKLNKDNKAYEWYLRTVKEDIHYMKAYDGLDRSSGKTGHAQVVVDLFNKHLAESDDAEFIRELKYRIGCLQLEYLNKSEEAQKIFEDLLADNPEDVRALGALERILEREGRFNELLEVNARRMDLAKSPEDRAETLLSGARIHENHLNDKDGAIEAYEQVCELLPEDPRPLVELHRLYAETEAYENLARVIEKQLELMGVKTAFSEVRTEAELADEGIATIVFGSRLERKDDGTAEWVERTVHGLDPEDAIALWFELGEVYRNHLSEYDSSVSCYDNILLMNLEHEQSIAALESLLENEIGVDTICLALSKVYASQEKWEALQNVLVKIAEVVPLSADKISYLFCASQINSEYLENPDAALDCLAKAMHADPAGSVVKAALLEAAEKYDKWEQVVHILEAVAQDISGDDNPELATQYAIELGSLYEREQLNDRDKSIEYGRQALELGKKRQEVLDYLKETFIRLESWEDVISVLRAEGELTEDDDEALLSLNMQIASIYETYLSKNDEAIDTLLEILEKHTENTDAMISLDRLYTASERWEEAVSNYERRLELVEDVAERDVIECSMASILSEHLNEVDRAFEIYSDILSHDGENEMAVSGLERMIEVNEGSIVEQIADLLLPIYDAKDNWEKRCWTDEQLLRVVIEPDRRRDLLHEIAGLYEQRGGDHEQAYAAFARSLKEDLRSEDTIAQLFNYADVLDKWADLVKVMEEATADAEADDPEAVRSIRGMVAEVYREHLGDIDSSIATYESIREQNPEDMDALNALEGLYQEKEAWKELSEILMAKAKLSDDPETRKALLFQAASLNEEILGDVDAAIAIHTDILAEESGEPHALDSLERLYIGKEEWNELLGVYNAKIENAYDDESRKQLYYLMGELQETKLSDNVGAVETYNNVLSIDPDDSHALEALDRLYLAGGDMNNLLDILQRREAIAEDDESRIVFKFRQAECKFRHLDDSLGAIEDYSAVFELNPAHEESIASLEEIIANGGESAVEAAKVLVPIYQGLERWQELVKVYEVLVTGSEDLEETIALLGTIGTVEEDMLGDAKAAFNAWYRALANDATRDSSWEKVIGLAAACDCYTELVQKLDELIPELSGDSTAAIIVAKHMAVIYEEQLNDPEKATDALRRVLDMDSNDVEAIHGLDHLYEVQEKWQDLADILHTEIDLSESDEDRLNSYYRLGAVQEIYLQNFDEAVNSYNEMLVMIPGQPEAIESLHRIFDGGHCCDAVANILETYYRDTEAWEQLVDLDLKYVEHLEDPNDRYDKFVEIADVYLNQLQMIPDGLAIYGRALADRPGDELCLTKIDELSEIIQDWSNNVSYYRNAIAACDDDTIKQDLTLRLARTYDVYLEDPQNAEECYKTVLGFDAEHLESLEALDRIYAAQERWQDLVEIIRREIPIVDSDEIRIQLYMRLGAVLNDMLGDGDGAIVAYNEILNIDPSYMDALVSLEAIYQGREDWISLCEVYEKQASASDDPGQRVELWGKMAQLNSEILNKLDDAVDLWYQVIDVTGDNLVALQNLEVLFIRAERWPDVADALERQLPLCEEAPELHLETYRKLGRVYRDKLEDKERSLEYWKQGLTVDPTDLESLRAIEALDEELDDQDDLAATLRQILQTGKLEFEDQLACAIKMAGVLDGLGRVDETIDTWLYVTQLDGTHAQALNELERLYTGEGRYEDVVRTLHAKIAATDDLEEKVKLYLQIADIWENMVGNIEQSAAAYMSILELDPARDSAFEMLETLYTNHEHWQDLLNAYIERAEVVGVQDQHKRLELLFKGARNAEVNMQAPEMAFVVLQSAIPENWKDDQLSEEIQRLAEVTGKWGELVEQYEGMIRQTPDGTYDSFTLHNTVARWYFHHLNNNEASWQHFQYVLNQDPSNLVALESMSEIFYRLGNWDELVNCLGKRLDLTTDTDARVTLFLELAKVYEEKLGDMGQAIDFYIQAYRLNDQRLDVMKELARIYEAAEQWNELVEILEKQLTVIVDPEDKIAVQYKIGSVWETRLNDNEKAANAYAAVLAMNEAHADGLKAMERVDISLGRWHDLLKVYNAQLAAFAEPHEQMGIYSKSSKIFENNLEDLDSAISSMVQVTFIDPGYVPAIKELERLYEKAGRWQDLIDVLNTHISVLSNVAEHVELYRKLGVVFRDHMGDAYHSVEAFQALISIKNDDVPALYALADLYQGGEDYISAIDYLNRVIACITDSSEIIDVHFRIGQVYDHFIQDDASAEERYKVCLDNNPGYIPAIDALAGLYERHEDWSNLVRILKQKVEHTRELDQKAEINCLLGNVSLHKLDDTVNAYAYYNEALSLQPDCVSAALPLAEKCLMDKAYARALLLYEIVINGSQNFADADNIPLYDLNYKAGYCCQNLAQHDRALEFYRASYELNQEYAPTLMGMGEELLEAQDYDRSYKMFQGLLERFGTELAPEEVIKIYHNSAIAKKNTGELALARQLLERILEADGSQTKSLELIIEVCDEMGDWEALAYYMNIHMDRQTNNDLKFAELMKIAKVYSEKINDPQRQIETYYKALEVEPGSRIVLNELLNIYYTTSQWENAIDVINRICESEENPEKIAKFYYTIAVIYRDELNVDSKAVEFFNKTLDTNVGELRAFEAIDRILTASHDWEGLERNYLAMIKRVNDDGSPELSGTRKLLWSGLGEIYRTRLNEWDNAIDAYRQASELSPKDEKIHTILSELYIRMPDHGREAIEEIRTLIDLQGDHMTPEQERRNYRSLFYLYYQMGDLDKAWCISDITYAKNIAMQDEYDHHENVEDMLSGQLPRLSADDIRRYLFHPQVSIELTNLFRTYQQCMRPAFCHKDKDEGIKKSRPLRTSNDSAFWRIYGNSSLALGVNPPPDVYDCEFLASGMRLANVDYNAFKIAQDMKGGRTMSELRFIISRNLFMFQNFFMAGITLTASSLKTLVITTMAYFQGRPNSNMNEKAIYDALYNVPKSLQGDLRRQLEAFVSQKIDLNISGWLKAVDLSCDRAGLLLSADYGTAVDCIKRDDTQISKLTVAERINELTRFAMSDEYFALRNSLNIKNYDDSDDMQQ